MFDSITHRVLSAVTPKDIQEANLLQKLTAAGISIDKALLLRNELPPTINVTVLMEVAEAIRAQEQGRAIPAPQVRALPAPEPQ
ncbi:MAG: hypothetical protein WCF30_09415 [Terracidiphilus sp.]